jgi:hypothetical protein
MGRISRHDFNDDIFDPLFQDFGMTYNNFFRDNFASNFRSNFGGMDFSDIFENIRLTRMNQENSHPPASKEVLKKLKRFKMNEKYCKKNEKTNKIENPNCCICLSDISNGEDTVLLPCGHLFHDPCVLEWLNKNNTCPICRFELPPQRN